MHRRLIHTLLFGLMVLLAGPAAAGDADDIAAAEALLEGDPDNLELLLEVGDHYLSLHRDGDQDAGKRANELLERAHELAPDNPRALTLRGAELILKGRDAKLPFNKMRHVNSGLELFDQAVELRPDDFGIRFQRANYCANLPGIFGRGETARGDFRRLLTMAAHAPDAVEPGYVTYIKLALARLLHADGETDAAETLLRELVDTPPTEDAPARAEKLLAELKG